MEIIVKTFEGLEDTLEKELQELGAVNVKKLRRAVSFDGDMEMVYKANLYLRTALKVLIPIFEFEARNERVFYNKIYDFNWQQYMQLSHTFSIDPVVRSKTFRHSQYAALKMKDAIVDKFRDKFRNRRPSVDREDPDLRINLYIYENKCSISLDSSGDSLHRRGFRSPHHRAPLNEVLAAGMILKTEWKGESPLYDPMCGSGTIAIEAAMIAQNQAPNYYRRKFAFMKWRDFDELLWNRIKKEAKKKIQESPTTIYASDESPKSIGLSRDAIRMAGVDDTVELITLPFAQRMPETEEGILVFNPPYNKRLEVEDIELLYQQIGDHLKTDYQGFDAWIISGNKEALKSIGLRTSKKMTLFNGSIECKFHKYELYSGTKKVKSEKTDEVENDEVTTVSETVEETQIDGNIKASEIIEEIDPKQDIETTEK